MYPAGEDIGFLHGKAMVVNDPWRSVAQGGPRPCGPEGAPTAAVTTIRCTFKIEDPSLGPGRVDFTAPDEGLCLGGTPKPEIQRDPSPQK